MQVQNHQRRLAVDTHWLSSQLTQVARREGLRARTIGVVLVSDRRLRQLNRNFHGWDQSTDVLTFDYRAEAEMDDVDAEVVVSAQTALAEARRRGLPPAGELLFYCIHGFLHLAGYGDASPAARRRMWRRQVRHLKQAGLPSERWQDGPPEDVKQ